MSKILSLSKLPQYRYLRFILVIVIVFFKDSLGSWGLEIKEFKHTLKEATAVCQILTQDDKLIGDHQTYYSTHPLQGERRNSFSFKIPMIRSTNY